LSSSAILAPLQFAAGDGIYNSRDVGGRQRRGAPRSVEGLYELESKNRIDVTPQQRAGDARQRAIASSLGHAGDKLAPFARRYALPQRGITMDLGDLG
jgi:hypothetical protein